MFKAFVLKYWRQHIVTIIWQVFNERFESDAVYLAAKQPVRKAAVMGVWSTPTFFVNDMEATKMVHILSRLRSLSCFLSCS